MGLIIGLVVGALIGWSLPKPAFVQSFQDKLKGLLGK
jgi:hypothetical protein